ncbi:MAG TPA: TonB-dependent receptor plug domain-containing protein, partial [Bacteroidia bacterium]|nr:TonB-dependent receptor plug domain-containing protein [Bacteroidia bacterium]
IKASDSTLVTGTTTDTTGSFQLEIKTTGTFKVHINFIGFKELYTDSFTIRNGVSLYNLGDLQLASTGQNLKGVQIVTEKPFMEHRMDRIVFNIENSIISSGNNGLEVLKKLPGVTVENESTIKVRGKSGVLIMIDGRTSYLSASDVANYLKSLDASQIEKIEVITNPSAKYDASGNAIINIILKKNKNLGLNAMLSGSVRQSVYSGSTFNINGNYRTRKFNYFGFYNFGEGYNFNGYDSKSIFSAGGEPTGSITEHTSNLSYGIYHTARLGADFTPDKRQTLGIAFDANYAPETIQHNTYTGFQNSLGATDSSLSRGGTAHTLNQRLTANLNYTFKIDSGGRELSANADYGWFQSQAAEQDMTTYTSWFYPRNP